MLAKKNYVYIAGGNERLVRKGDILKILAQSNKLSKRIGECTLVVSVLCLLTVTPITADAEEMWEKDYSGYEAYAAEAGGEGLSVSDPAEPVNRVLFGLNYNLDKFMIKPMAVGYGHIVPEKPRGMIDNFFHNLSRPVTAFNHLLQGNVTNAGHALWSFGIDTLIGGGLIGIPQAAGITPPDEDFNQTLAVWGVPSGPYVVLPLFGPSTIRGVVGTAVDMAGDPTTYLFASQGGLGGVQTALNVTHTRHEILPFTDAIEDSAPFDIYSAYKSGYVQNTYKSIQE